MKLSLQIRATLTILLVSISQILFAQCPTITVNPNPVNLLCAGTTLNLNADVISATSFKWQKNGVDVGNTTKPSLFYLLVHLMRALTLLLQQMIVAILQVEPLK